MAEKELKSGSSSQDESCLEDMLVPWEPIENIPGILLCEGIYDDYEGFRILLRGRGAEDKMLRIAFEGLIGYRNVNESYRLRSLPPTSSGTLFRVEKSSWISWLCEESGGVLFPSGLMHFAIFTPEDFLDVATQRDPKVGWLNG